jgi:anaerobic magnesium-protoporphyrin IX monomethyl ester cyclase
MNRKVVLVKPPERSFFNFGTFSLGALGAAVRHLADVSILDATNPPISEAVDEVWSRQPDLVGITVMGLSSVRPATDFIQQLKAAGNDCGNGAGYASIIAGGHGTSMVPAILLEAGADAVVIGEGELTFQQIVEQGTRPGAPGVACLASDRVVTGPPQPLVNPLDRLVPPARDLMPPPPNGIHLMETSRGCPHACAFCETTRFYGRRWRPHSPERVAAEVKRLVDDYDAWIIHFADDNFAASPGRVRRICEELQKQTLPAFFMVSARADDLVADPDLLPAMAAARILRITVGVETLDLEMALKVGKPISPETFKEAFGRMRELEIFSVASLIVGLPGEDPAARKRSVKLAVEAGPDSAHFLPFLPLPGIPLASGRSGLDPDPADVRDAHEFNRAFFQHPIVQARLKAAAASGGIRGLLARATLENRSRSLCA